MLPTHYNDKRHLDAGTSVHGAGHLPLQAATAFLQPQQPHSTQASRYRDCWHPSQLWPKLSAARGHLNPSSGAGHTGPV